MNRIDRVTAILIQLQSKKIVKAQDIAERFSISLRTVYRDVKTLEEAGIPIIGEAGVGYSIMEGYRLPPVMFTREEATAFLTAEKLIEKFTDNSTEEGYKSAMYKVRAVLRSSEKDLLENIDEHIEVLKSRAQQNTKQTVSPLQTILKSISSKNVLFIKYAALNAPTATDRHIEPVGVFYMSNYWYLIAFCRLRGDYRNFRTDRMLQITITDEKFEKEHPSLKSYLERVATQETELHKVIMQVDKEVMRYFGEQKYYNGYVSESDLGNRVEMTFLSSSIEGFARWYLMFGDRADIIQPNALKERIKCIAANIAAKI
ncbi:MAG TPA: YafY family protein [Chitinophagaceae bacterium]|nr:YafY family protein [Chitinophagaceae bacterium]